MGKGERGVGSIVWVRRRNGSWWPGKILGPHDLSSSHLLSPRSGTPVKLLGREDASVDWYNLEKSKRVKAFRCSEFADFIRHAEASQSLPPKKREKYARREDAILHALELERQLLGKKYGGLGRSSTYRSNKSTDGFSKRETRTSSKYLENGYGGSLRSKSHQLSKKSGFFLEEKSTCNSTVAEEPQNRNQFSGDDDNSNVPLRMRGLQDLGLSAAPSELIYPQSIGSDNADQLVVCSSAHAVPDGSYNTERLVNFRRKSSIDKRKLSEEGFAEQILAKRRDRRRALAQVLENSENLPVSLPVPDSASVLGVANKSLCNLADEPGEFLNVEESNDVRMEFSTLNCADNSFHPAELPEQNGSASTEYTDTDTESSETDSVESDTDDDLATFSDGAASIELEPKYIRICAAQPEHESMSSEEMSELALADDNTSQTFQQESVSAGFGVSKWQLKGKRNNRSLNKRPVDHFDMRRPYHVSNFNKAPRTASRNMFNWADWAWDDQPASRGYWEEPVEYFDSVNRFCHPGGRKMLIDVDLKVQSSYQRVHVPIISMTSKTNGQSIIGYPIQIEALSNGSSDSLLGAIDYNFQESSDNDTALHPTWRTARRTASLRVPRPHASSELDNPSGIKHVQGFDCGKNVPKAYAGDVVQKGIMTRKTTISQPAIERTFSRKSGKRISLSSHQKIRTLSSIASQQKHSDLTGSSDSYQVNGAIKAETLPTVVACIPVKLVFSRLNEELVGRHQ